MHTFLLQCIDIGTFILINVWMCVMWIYFILRNKNVNLISTVVKCNAKIVYFILSFCCLKDIAACSVWQAGLPLAAGVTTSPYFLPPCWPGEECVSCCSVPPCFRHACVYMHVYVCRFFWSHSAAHRRSGEIGSGSWFSEEWTAAASHTNAVTWDTQTVNHTNRALAQPFLLFSCLFPLNIVLVIGC